MVELEGLSSELPLPRAAAAYHTAIGAAPERARACARRT
jgi:hypothetical protein